MPLGALPEDEAERLPPAPPPPGLGGGAGVVGARWVRHGAGPAVAGRAVWALHLLPQLSLHCCLQDEDLPAGRAAVRTGPPLEAAGPGPPGLAFLERVRPSWGTGVSEGPGGGVSPRSRTGHKASCRCRLCDECFGGLAGSRASDSHVVCLWLPHFTSHPLLGAAPGGERPPLSKGQHSPARRVHREVGLGSLPQLASAESHSGNIRVHACFLTSVWGFLCPDVELRAAWSDVLTVT